MTNAVTSVRSHDKVIALAATQCLSFSRRSTGVGEDVSLLCEQCGPILLCVWESDVESQRRYVTPLIKKAYHLYFGCKLGDQAKKWALHIVCNMSWRPDKS